ncbi:MAG: hypothetical protein AAF413_02560 [Patescibacteria group bacterium]
MKSLNPTLYIEACRGALKDWESDPESAARTLAFDIPLTEDAHPMLKRVSSIAWDIQEFGLDAPTVDVKKDFATITSLLDDYEANDWLDIQWSVCFTYSNAVDRDYDSYVNVALHADCNGYRVESSVKELSAAIEKLAVETNRKQSSEWFVKLCSKQAPKSVGEYRYKYCDISFGLA